MNDAVNTASERVYKSVCEALLALGYPYTETGRSRLDFSATGHDIPMAFSVTVFDDTVLLYSYLPFAVEASRTKDMAIAISSVNYRLADGSFDYLIEHRSILFRMTASHLDSEIGVELLDYMIRCSVMTVDRYNDKLLLLSRGLLSLDAFHEEIGFQ